MTWDDVTNLLQLNEPLLVYLEVDRFLNSFHRHQHTLVHSDGAKRLRRAQ